MDKCTGISFFLLTWADLKRFSFQVVKKVFLLKGKLFIKVLMFSFFHPGIEPPAPAELSTNVNGLIKTFIRTALFLTAFAECFT